MNCSDLVKQLDWYLGLWSLGKDKDKVRRSLYGKAGACRIKPYGVEYRVLSNFWIKNKKSRLETWNRMVKGIEEMKRLYMPEYSQKIVGYKFDDYVIEAINSGKIDQHTRQTFQLDRKSTRLNSSN